jgi:hypothetical protein
VKVVAGMRDIDVLALVVSFRDDLCDGTAMIKSGSAWVERSGLDVSCGAIRRVDRGRSV